MFLIVREERGRSHRESLWRGLASCLAVQNRARAGCTSVARVMALQNGEDSGLRSSLPLGVEVVAVDGPPGVSATSSPQHMACIVYGRED